MRLKVNTSNAFNSVEQSIKLLPVLSCMHVKFYNNFNFDPSLESTANELQTTSYMVYNNMGGAAKKKSKDGRETELGLW